MINKEKEKKYYLHTFSNLLAAFGGGMILGKGVGVIDIPFLQGSSILAFFVGSVLGLGLLQFFPKKWAAIIPVLFSTLAAITSLILLFIFKNNAINDKISSTPALVFFVLLCVRFGFWFYSRVLRASLAAGKQQKIAWVELGYYVGMILGLIIWKFLGISIGMVSALALDSLLQLTAGVVDFKSSRLSVTTSSLKNSTSENIYSNVSAISLKKKAWVWRLAGAVMLMTVGVQVVIFSLAHHVSEWLSSYIIAFYYFGAALAAIVCRRFQFQLEWDFTKSRLVGYAKISSNISTRTFNMSLIFFGLIPLVSVIFTIIAALYWSYDIGIALLLLFFIVVSAFFYEITALSLLDRISKEEKANNKNGMIIRTYGLMAMAAAVSLWGLSLLKNPLNGLVLTLLLCLFVTILSVWKRDLAEI